MIITLLAQNVARGGLYNSAGEYRDRWPLLAKRINQVKPDILLLSELNGWKDYGHKQLVRAANDLDLDAAPLSPTQTGYGTGLLYQKETVGRWQFHNDSLSYATTHGYSVTGFDVGLPALLNVAPVHLSFYSADKAAQEAQLVISKVYAQTPFAIIGGDINHSPAGGPSPDFRQAKPYNLSARTVIDSGTDVAIDGLTPNRRVAWTLKRGGFVDAVDHLYEQTHDKNLLRPTGGNERIDQLWVSKAVAPALVSYDLTNHDTEASDHAGIIIKIDTEKIDLVNNVWGPDKL